MDLYISVMSSKDDWLPDENPRHGPELRYSLHNSVFVDQTQSLKHQQVAVALRKTDGYVRSAKLTRATLRHTEIHPKNLIIEMMGIISLVW